MAAPVLPAPVLPAPIILQPQITVPSAPPPAITVQPPASSQVVVIVASFAALFSLLSAAAAWFGQWFLLRKEAAVIEQGFRTQAATRALLAFENNVARPAGLALDVLERRVAEIPKLRPSRPGREQADLEANMVRLLAELANAARLCREAEGALPGPLREVFRPILQRAGLDDLLFGAVEEALTPLATRPPGVIQLGYYDEAIRAVTDVKIAIRRQIEMERAGVERQLIGDIVEHPLYPLLDRLRVRPRTAAPTPGVGA